MTDHTAAIAAMLRQGATYRHITAQLGASHHTIARVRATHNIPVPNGRGGTHQRRDIRDQIATMLRTGATYHDIKTQLGVSSSTIAGVRRDHDIPLPPGRGNRPAPDTDTQIAELLRDGATYTQITTKLRVSVRRIATVRHTHDIPVPHTHAGPHTTRTPEQTLALYSTPATNGHTHWTGPHSRGRPQIWHHSHVTSGLRIAFRQTHGREPQGRVMRGCDDPHCITGTHLTDHTIRQANKRADTAYEHIFGTTP